jgi:large subunit ribosomal protein L25
MDKIKLKVNLREEKGKTARAIRRDGNIPAVLYGKGKETKSLFVSSHDFEKMYREAGTSSIVLLAIEGNGEKNVLVQDVAYNAYTSKPEHADFYEVSMTEKITTTIPLVFIGDSPAVIEMDGTLVTNKNEVEIECLPADLPHDIEVDISSLSDFEKAIHVSDLKVPSGVEIKDEAEEMIVTVEPPRSEEELAELEETPEEVEMPESETGGEELVEGEEGEEGEKSKPTETPTEPTELKKE